VGLAGLTPLLHDQLPDPKTPYPELLDGEASYLAALDRNGPYRKCPDGHSPGRRGTGRHGPDALRAENRGRPRETNPRPGRSHREPENPRSARFSLLPSWWLVASPAAP
jgi:hypothetical protein